MKRWLMLVGVLMLAVGWQAAAQEDQAAWRLRVPTAAEHLSTFIKIAESVDSVSENEFFRNTLPKISSSFFYLFPESDEITFALLLDTYTTSKIATHDLLARDQWVRYMIAAWIDENNIDLSQTSKLEFEDFYIRVIPRDFNGDGQNEYVLDASKGGEVDRKSCEQHSEIIAYYVVEQAENGYRFVDTSLPWKGNAEYGRYSYGYGSMDEIGFEDLNGDDLPEWIILVGGETYGGPGMGYADGGRLLIMGWRGNGLTYLIPTIYSDRELNRAETTDFSSLETIRCSSPYPVKVKWEFKNVDDDPAREIFQIQTYTNNWLCDRNEIKLFDWNEQADQYQYIKTDVEYDGNSQNCAQMRAEEVLWTGNYKGAIPLLEQALTLEPNQFEEDYYQEKATAYNQYLRARLALAYLMTDQQEKADSVLEILQSEIFTEEAIWLFVERMIEAEKTKSLPMQVCAAVYKVFTENFPTIRLGYTGDDELFYSNNPYQPELIGCDAPNTLREILTTTHISIDQLPVEFLAEIGIAIDHSLQTDLNDDGQLEWLMWLDIPGGEVFFAPEGNHYQISYPNVDPYQFADTLTSWKLPNDAGSAIALIRFDLHGSYFAPWAGIYDSTFGFGGGGPICTENDRSYIPGEFALWELKGVELVKIFSQWGCNKQLEEFFPSGERSPALHIAYAECANEYCDSSVMDNEVFTWDAAVLNYIAPEKAASTLVSTPMFQPTTTPSPFPQYYSVLDAFDQQNFEAVVGLTAEKPSSESPQAEDYLFGDYYLRALALEALERPEEALAEYVAIYEAAPESAWGMLAGLHIEPTNKTE